MHNYVTPVSCVIMMSDPVNHFQMWMHTHGQFETQRHIRSLYMHMLYLGFSVVYMYMHAITEYIECHRFGCKPCVVTDVKPHPTTCTYMYMYTRTCTFLYIHTATHAVLRATITTCTSIRKGCRQQQSYCTHISLIPGHFTCTKVAAVIFPQEKARAGTCT